MSGSSGSNAALGRPPGPRGSATPSGWSHPPLSHGAAGQHGRRPHPVSPLAWLHAALWLYRFGRRHGLGRRWAMGWATGRATRFVRRRRAVRGVVRESLAVLTRLALSDDGD